MFSGVLIQAKPELVEGVAAETASAFDKLRRRLYLKTFAIILIIIIPETNSFQDNERSNL